MAEGRACSQEDVEYEPINVTVKDDNGKARIQTSPIPGLTPGDEQSVSISISTDCIKISAQVKDKNDPTKHKMHHSIIKLSQDITARCQVDKKEIEKDGRLIIYIKKKDSFKLAQMVNIKR